ncbi:MAG TPA: hypothetical protein VJ927_03275 [Actinomycetota bacterium]|nr:hypothetical protein [Actinomycetota bacterium]
MDTPDRSEDHRAPDVEIPADAPEADVLDQARPWQPETEEELPASIGIDEPEADALDQARPADLDDEPEEPA